MTLVFVLLLVKKFIPKVGISGTDELKNGNHDLINMKNWLKLIHGYYDSS